MKTINVQYPCSDSYVRQKTFSIPNINGKEKLISFVSHQFDMMQDNPNYPVAGRVDCTIIDEQSATILRQFSFWYRPL